MNRPGLLALLAASLSACAAPRVGVMPRVAATNLDGHVAVAMEGSTLADNTLDDALGLEEDSSAPGLRVDADFGAPVLMLAWGRTEDSGTGTLEGELSDNGVTLPVGTDVASDVRLDLYSGILTFDLVPTDTFELGLGLGVHLVDVQATIESQDAGNPGTISVDETVPIPVLAARAGVVVGRFDLSAVASGLKVSYGGDDATFYDVDVAARFRLLGGDHLSGSIALGWRHTVLDAELEDGGDRADLDLTLSGPYFGIVVGF